METQSPNQANAVVIQPYVSSSYSHGWRQMWKYVIEALLLIVMSTLISLPTIGLNSDEFSPFLSRILSIDLIFIEFHGTAALIIFSVAYLILFEWPMEYGFAYGFLRLARDENLQVKDVFKVFQNYSSALLANLLTVMIILIGFMMLIVPGIVFACKLAFVPYLVVDKNMDVISAVRQSWHMTRGHAFSIFLIGFLAIFISLGGLIAFLVGIIFSIIWIRLASASMYHAVSSRMEDNIPVPQPATT